MRIAAIARMVEGQACVGGVTGEGGKVPSAGRVSAARAILRAASRPSHWAVIGRDLLGFRHGLTEDRIHLRAAVDWLARAQDVTGGGGVSAGYYFASGWLPPYPETTGYTICTLMRYTKLTDEGEWTERAMRMGDWEIDVQLPAGGIRGQIGLNAFPIVFNTGQVILGWVGLYLETCEKRFLDAAVRAGNWLIETQDADGKWSRCDHAGVPHAYQSRVAWPLLELARSSGDPKYRRAAERCIEWVLSNVRPNGWIDHMAFVPHQKPYTHTIVYTLRGLLESSAHLGDADRRGVRAVVLHAAETLLMRFERSKSDPYGPPADLPGQFDEHWRPAARYTCLTGDCQLSILWHKLYAITDDPRFVNAALKLMDQVKATQKLRSANPGVRGAIAGSYPLWGGYERFGYPNWAAKFFADAIMCQEKTLEQIGAKP